VWASEDVLMRRQAFVATTIFMALLAFLDIIHADEKADLQAVADKFIRILSAAESEFDCLFKIESVKRIPEIPESASKYYAEYRAAGSECGEASAVLDSQGEKEGIVFYWLDTYIEPSETGRERILDLLHQIDPPDGQEPREEKDTSGLAPRDRSSGLESRRPLVAELRRSPGSRYNFCF
jgi:hypothetical protein